MPAPIGQFEGGEPRATSMLNRMARLSQSFQNMRGANGITVKVDPQGGGALIFGPAVPVGGPSSSIPKPTRRYQIFTPIDDTLTPIWTTGRFTDQVTPPVPPTSNGSSGSTSGS